MPNSYYVHGSYPATGSAGASAGLRAELDAVTAGFDLLPTITANGGKVVAVNAGATALTVLATTGTGSVVLATSPALLTPTGIVKGDVGLGNVDNTSDVNKPVSTAQQTALNLKQDTSGKDVSGGYAGLTLFKINFKNALNTFTSFFSNSNTAARTYTFADRDGTIADNTDLALKANLSGAVFTGDVALPSINGGQLAGLQNRIINGGMTISQRNGTTALTVGTAFAFGADRFGSSNNTASGTLTVQQSTMTGFGRSLKATATAAITTLTTNNYLRPCLNITEGQNSFDLNGKTVTLSFKVETNWVGNLAVSVRSSGDNRSYVTTVSVISGINSCSVTLQLEAATVATNDNAVGLRFDIGFCNEGQYQTSTTGSWIAGNFYTSTTSTQWCKTAGNFVNITQVKLEQGAIATTSEQRSIGLELALCQRYYQTARYHIIGSGYAIGAYVGSRYIFGTTMRSAPTVSVTFLSSTNISSVTFYMATPEGFTLYGTATAAGTLVEYTSDVANTAEYF